MRLVRLCQIALMAALAGAVGIAPAMATGSTPRAVVELFTSQGCSSCPPADRVLRELARDPTLVALTMPVDLWDYLGWRDTLADPGHTRRQRGYAANRGDRKIYTPQAVVSGVGHVNGADLGAIEGAIARRRAAPLVVPVALEIAGGRIGVTLAEAAVEGQKVEVWLCGVRREVTVPIAQGENRGHSLTYANVVRTWVKAGDWAGNAASFAVARGALGPDVDAVAVLVQVVGQKGPGAILGAAFAGLP